MKQNKKNLQKDLQMSESLAEHVPTAAYERMFQKSEQKYRKLTGQKGSAAFTVSGRRSILPAVVSIAACAVMGIGMFSIWKIRENAAFVEKGSRPGTAATTALSNDEQGVTLLPEMDLEQAQLYFLTEENMPYCYTLAEENLSEVVTLLTESAVTLEKQGDYIAGGNYFNLYVSCEGEQSVMRFWSDGYITQIFPETEQSVCWKTEDAEFWQNLTALVHTEPETTVRIPYQTFLAASGFGQNGNEVHKKILHMLFDASDDVQPLTDIDLTQAQLYFQTVESGNNCYSISAENQALLAGLLADSAPGWEEKDTLEELHSTQPYAGENMLVLKADGECFQMYLSYVGEQSVVLFHNNGMIEQYFYEPVKSCWWQNQDNTLWQNIQDLIQEQETVISTPYSLESGIVPTEVLRLLFDASDDVQPLTDIDLTQAKLYFQTMESGNNCYSISAENQALLAGLLADSAPGWEVLHEKEVGGSLFYLYLSYQGEQSAVIFYSNGTIMQYFYQQEKFYWWKNRDEGVLWQNMQDLIQEQETVISTPYRLDGTVVPSEVLQLLFDAPDNSDQSDNSGEYPLLTDIDLTQAQLYFITDDGTPECYSISEEKQAQLAEFLSGSYENWQTKDDMSANGYMMQMCMLYQGKKSVVHFWSDGTIMQRFYGGEQWHYWKTDEQFFWQHLTNLLHTPDKEVTLPYPSTVVTAMDFDDILHLLFDKSAPFFSLTSTSTTGQTKLVRFNSPAYAPNLFDIPEENLLAFSEVLDNAVWQELDSDTELPDGEFVTAYVHYSNVPFALYFYRSDENIVVMNNGEKKRIFQTSSDVLQALDAALDLPETYYAEHLIPCEMLEMDAAIWEVWRAVDEDARQRDDLQVYRDITAEINAEFYTTFSSPADYTDENIDRLIEHNPGEYSQMLYQFVLHYTPEEYREMLRESAQELIEKQPDFVPLNPEELQVIFYPNPDYTPGRILELDDIQKESLCGYLNEIAYIMPYEPEAENFADVFQSDTGRHLELSTESGKLTICLDDANCVMRWEQFQDDSVSLISYYGGCYPESIVKTIESNLNHYERLI